MWVVSLRADVKEPEWVLETLDKLIVDKNYFPEQIFAVDKASRFWKQIPKSILTHKEAKSVPGFKAFKDRITPLRGGNVADHKLKCSWSAQLEPQDLGAFQWAHTAFVLREQ